MVTENNILSLIPQRPPFVMVDALAYTNEKTTGTFLKITEQNIFVNNGVLTEPGLVENIAQTAAARAGYTAMSKNEPVSVGYIGAVQNLEITTLPEVNNTIHTKITVDNEIMNVLLITGTITCSDTEIARCSMKIFITQK
ncbi:MAG: 3-hydroxyacyl-ACP dehydratase [Panacibacter sp.]